MSDRKLVALDAGHGLKTAGKETPDGIKEWTLNDKVRDKVVAMLKDYNVDFIFPDNNEGNTDEKLSNRRTMYVKAKVDAAISIHHNAYTGEWNTATGVGIYMDKNHTAADKKLAECIYPKMVEYIGLRGRGYHKANFSVINQNTVPAVLIEGGFMDGKKDYPVIISDEGQTAYAKAVAEGLIEFLDLKKVNASEEKPAIDKTEKPATTPAPSTNSAQNKNQSTVKKVTANEAAKSKSESISGTYITDANLNMRHGAGTSKRVMVIIPKNTKVCNYGYYTEVNGTKWYYVQATVNNVVYTGFCSSKYLDKI